MNILNKIFKQQKEVPVPKDIEYFIGDSKIILHSGHALPKYQKEHRLYDRFLPILAKHLPKEKIIVDVGANVGDTLISMIKNLDNKFYCVEPSNEFYEYLKMNISFLDKHLQKNIKIYKNLIGTNNFAGNIVENGLGTASLNIDDNTISNSKTISLDELLKNEKDIILIKVDTDGFDFDVLLSGNTICKNEKPILFWENEVKTEYQKNGYYELYDFLESNGYTHLFIFDNFGNLMLENSNFKTLSDLTEYIYSMNQQKSTRTIYYNDVLAVCPNNLHIANNAINEYKRLIKS